MVLEAERSTVRMPADLVMLDALFLVAGGHLLAVYSCRGDTNS